MTSGPGNGVLTLNADGSFTYTPNPGYNGIDSFIYEVSDGNGGTDTATVTINVGGVNDIRSPSMMANRSPKTPRSRPPAMC